MQENHQNASHSCTYVPSNGQKLTQTGETCEVKYLLLSVLLVSPALLLQSRNLPCARHVHMLDYPVI
jgi:hypothetical protein